MCQALCRGLCTDYLSSSSHQPFEGGAIIAPTELETEARELQVTFQEHFLVSTICLVRGYLLS